MRSLLLSSLFLTLVPVLRAQVITPAEHARIEGNTVAGNYYSGAWWATSSSTYSRAFRLQQIVDHKSSVKGALIAVIFRRDGRLGAGLLSPNIWIDMQLTVSTAKTTSWTMSNSWNSNIGTDATVVISRKKVSVPPRPFLGSFPEPFLISFRFDKKFPYDASKGSICLDLRHYDNNLYSVATGYRYLYADACYGNSSYGANFMSGPRCFNSNPYTQAPMRHYSSGYYDSSTRKMRWYWYGYDMDPNVSVLIVWSLGRSGTPIPLGCGKFQLSLSSMVAVMAATSDYRGSFRWPAKGYLEWPWDTKLPAMSFYSQAIMIAKNGKWSATNYYIRNTPVQLPTGKNFPHRTSYRTGTTAFTSSTGYLRSYGYGPVLQWAGLK